MTELTFQSESHNGIEFYVSNDGQKTGMSIAGLARCCGVSHATLRGIFKALDGGTTTIEKLKPFIGKVFFESGDGGSENNAKIIQSEVCAAVITYYAFDSKSAKNDTAKETLLKFASIGIDTWIKQLVGYKNDNEKILSTLSTILKEVENIKSDNEKLKPIVAKYINVKDGVKTTFPGLNEVMESIEDERYKQLASADKVPLSDWLRGKRILLTNGGYCAFGRMVSECYKAMKMEEPKKGNMKKANGKWSMNVRLYSQKDYPILEMALKQFLSKSA